jgi:hypothetical protein
MIGAGCKPDFGTPSSLVTEKRVLAVKNDPAEVRPGVPVTLTPLVVSPDGTEQQPSIDWALCMTPKPLDENNVVAAACLADGVMELGVGPTEMTPVPLTACQLFGPDPPPVMPGMPPLRPRDPDVSGGYYQPIRATEDGVIAFNLTRVTCNLAQAGADIAVQFAKEYTANTNPSLTALDSTEDITAIPPGTTTTFTVGWPDAAAETYPVYDVASQTIVMHRESLRVSWFASDGSFVHEHTGVGEDETDTTTSNDWTAPTAPGVVHLWVVLRDSRGGMDFASYDLTIGP